MKLSTFFAASFALLLTSFSASAEDWQAKVKSQKLGSFPLPQPVQLTYQGSFANVVKSGKVSFIFGKKDKRYPHFYISQSYGGSSFKRLPYTYDMTSFINPKTQKPRLLVANEYDDEEKVKIFNTYHSSSVEHKKTTTLFKSGEVEEKAHKFGAVPIHDPLSAMLFLRSQKLEVGEKTYMCIHPFASPYFATVNVLKKEIHMGQPCLKIDLALRKIDKKTNQLKAYKKLKKATIWITDDAKRIPLEYKIEVNIAGFTFGYVRLKLTSQQKP